MKLAITAMIAGKAVVAVIDLPPIVWMPRGDNGRDPVPPTDTVPQAILRIDICDDDHMVTFR